MAAEIDFQPYLQSISTHYEQWWRLYTLTDAETQAQQTNEPQHWKTPFDFGLMVQTVLKSDRPLGSDDPDFESQSPNEKIERFPVLEGIRKFVKDHRQVLLVGRPGSGKSTTLARLLLEEARGCSAIDQSINPLLGGARGGLVDGAIDRPTPPSGHPSEEGIGDGTCIPVLVELRFLSNSTLLDRIQAFFQRHDLQLDCTQIEDLLFHRRLLLLMDGLNELPSEATRLDVAKFRQDYPKVSMIFTTRDLSLGGDFGLEKKLEMQPLTEAQIQAFVRSYVPEQAEAMLRQLKDRLREFGQTPLLLWMLCGLFRQTGQIPNNLGEVFRAFTQGYEKNLKADVPVECDRRWWPELLQELAFAMMHSQPVVANGIRPLIDVEFRVAIPKAEVHQIFAKFLHEKEVEPKGDAQRSLDDLLRHHLIQDNGEQVEFRYQLLQEYYAAEYLLRCWEHIGELKFKRDHLNYLKWTEPISLMIGLIDHQNLVLQLVRYALDIDLRLGARLLGAAKPDLQSAAIDQVSELKIPECLKVELLGETRSDAAIPPLVKILETATTFDVRESAAHALEKLSSEQAIPDLLKALEHRNADVCCKAADVLKQLGSKQTIPGWLRALESEHSDMRRRAANALARLGSEQTIPDLRKVLTDENSDVRCSAVDALGIIGSEQAVPDLLKALKDKNPDVRCRAVDTLGNLDSKRAIPALLQVIKDESPDVRCMATFALGKLNAEQVIPDLLKDLENEDFEVRCIAVQALGLIGSEQAVPGLLKALENESFGMHWYDLADALEKIASTQVIPGLLNVLTKKNSNVRWRAAYILGQIGSDQAIPVLLNVLEETDIRVSVVLALGQIGSELAIPVLLNVLEDEISEVRCRAAESLGKIGSVQALPGLLRTLKDQDSYVRRGAVDALGSLGSEQAISGLLRTLEDKDLTVRRNATEALGKIGSEQAISGLLKALEDEDSEVRQNAVIALGKLGSETSILGLLKALEDEDADVREITASVLGRLGSVQAIPVLLKALEDEDGSVRRKAADGLKQIGSAQAIPGLLQTLGNQDSFVRRRVADALGIIGSAQAIPGLLQALEDENLTVRKRVVDALGKINNTDVSCILPQLLALIHSPLWENAVRSIANIQSNCKFYSYNMIQTTHSMKLFCSYTHKDKLLRDELAKHLSFLKRQGIITDWCDRNITAGTDWAQAIDQNLDTANIILLLISSDFLASDYCYDKEMTRALEHHHQGTTRIIPIILRSCDWHSAPFGKLQALPIAHGGRAKPVTQWDNPDEAFTHIVQGIRKAVAELQQRTND